MSKSSLTKKIDQSVLNKVKQELESGAYVKIGILGGVHKSETTTKDGKTKEKSLPMAELGYVHEFGQGNVPERSFLRKSVAIYDKKFSQWLQANQTKIQAALVEKGLFFVLNKMGAWWVERVHDTFDAEGPGWPALSEGYAAWKAIYHPGKDKLLVTTSALKQSITHEVVE